MRCSCLVFPGWVGQEPPAFAGSRWARPVLPEVGSGHEAQQQLALSAARDIPPCLVGQRQSRLPTPVKKMMRG